MSVRRGKMGDCRDDCMSAMALITGVSVVVLLNTDPPPELFQSPASSFL